MTVARKRLTNGTMFVAKVYISLKPTVNDPQGQTIMGSLHNLGFNEVSKVRAGKYLELIINEADNSVAEARVKSMCDKLLANMVIEEYTFKLEELATAG